MADHKIKESLHGERQRYLEFQIGEENFAIPLLSVKEVIGVPSSTAVPNAPPYFVGIMNLRGQVISIIDLSHRLGVKSDKVSPEAAVVILDLGQITIGVTVDAVKRVIAIDDGALSEPPDMSQQDYVTNVHKNETDMTLIVDIGKILNINDILAAQSNVAA